jgi:hypothetical protein
MVEKDERPDHAALRIREYATDLETSKVALARRKRQFYRSVWNFGHSSFRLRSG